MGRLDQERQQRLEPRRMETAMETLQSMGYTPESDGNCISFTHKDSPVKYFPYTGWATGKTIKDGRGLNWLVDQLKK